MVAAHPPMPNTRMPMMMNAAVKDRCIDWKAVMPVSLIGRPSASHSRADRRSQWRLWAHQLVEDFIFRPTNLHLPIAHNQYMVDTSQGAWPVSNNDHDAS